MFLGIRGGVTVLLTYTLALILARPSNAAIEDDLQLEVFKYASERAPTFYLSNSTPYYSNEFLGQMNLYFESGAKGAWSVDPDPVRVHLFLDDTKRNFFWIGREHPLNLTRTQPVEPTSALGNIWAQNQLDALNPRVSGWIGLGLLKSL